MSRQPEEQADTLIIDRAAAAEIPSADAIQQWAREKRAFISSVMSELAEERRAVAAALREEGVRPVMFEEFGGRDADPLEAYLGEVEGSDIFVGILGKTYGAPLRTRYSATHTEYLHAEKYSLRIAMWTSHSPDREGPEQSFLTEARTFHVIPEYRNVADLQAQIRERIRAIAAEDLAPWCKLGRVVFRASEVEDRGDNLTVVGRIRDDSVARALEETRGGKWNRPPILRFTWAGRSRYVKVSRVQVTTTAARSRTIRVDLEAAEEPQDSLRDMSINGMTADEISEVALRAVLFGEPSGFDRDPLAFAYRIEDPLQALRDAHVSEEIIRPLTELLVTDLLVGTGRAGRVAAFRLSVAVRGRRNLTLGWETPRRYSNEEPVLRTIEGEVNL
jgi:hypothetical protein